MNNKLKTWRFGIDNDKLVELVLSGKKLLLLVFMMKKIFQLLVKNLY